MDDPTRKSMADLLRGLLNESHAALLAEAEKSIEEILAEPPDRRPHFSFLKDGQPIPSQKAELVTEIIAIFNHPLMRIRGEAEQARLQALSISCIIDDYVTQLYEPKKFPDPPPKPTVSEEQQEELKGKVQ